MSSHILKGGWLKRRLLEAEMNNVTVLGASGNSSATHKQEELETFRSG